MDSATYDKHWAVFEATAKPLLNELRERVQRYYGIACGAIDKLDWDVERGLGFVAQLRNPSEDTDNNVFLELVLVDGDEAGFGTESDEPQVGVTLAITDKNGVEYTKLMPGNFTDAVGTSDAVVLVEKIKECVNLDEVPNLVLTAWERAFHAASLGSENSTPEPAAPGARALGADTSPSP